MTATISPEGNRVIESRTMDLRLELCPPTFDESLIERLAELAARIDGAQFGEWKEWLEEFNHLAGMEVPFEDFQGIYGGEDHIDWVRRLVSSHQIQPASDVTREELIEVVRRAMPQSGLQDSEEYMAIFDANVSIAGASDLIFNPPDHDPTTNTWGGGRPIEDYDPTPEQIVDWVLKAD